MNKASDEVAQLTVRELLGGKESYLIPMYQRNYAWEEGEITQLIQDIIDYMPEERPYYIGSLVVFRRQAGKETVYETIDGQQRLTTLSLLTAYLRNNGSQLTDWFQETKLRFESRPVSMQTFDAILNRKIKDQPGENLAPNDTNTGILNGYRLIGEKLNLAFKNRGDELRRFEKFLFEQVQVMRIQVPDDTDLNHYFEIMNSRGEQLEKHEVLKAKLMEVLDRETDPTIKATAQHALHLVWEACSNMEKYLQSGFPPKLRDALFGHQKWNQLHVHDFEGLREAVAEHGQHSEKTASKSLTAIISKPVVGPDKTQIDDNAPDSFNSVVNFPNFLLHILRISINQDASSEESDPDVPLDDKRLIQVFESYLLKANNPLQLARSFIFSLLKGKYLFDHYIIKREFLKGSDAWSLKQYKWNKGSSRGSAGSNSYVNTFTNEESTNRSLLMLLSAFHVSTPTMVYKHWLNAALDYLFRQTEINAESYLSHLESVARAFVFDRFLAPGEGKDYYQVIYINKGRNQTSPSEVDPATITPYLTFGNIENNLVFNYLDYLLWKRYRNDPAQKKIADYEFTFRSSVEHYYPRHPMEDIEPLSEEPLNSFGNLCLISHSKNSRLSNFSPTAKKDYYAGNTIDSPKQHLMMQFDTWNVEAIQEHQGKMLKVLLER